ncbi:S-layer homology domain-containing protein [Candidatus Synechococcus spongiarum]|uniref:S-layer homology domain-containing protein n=1 Tax=Candidatus Synechococcus spongiarum TaxID=431041 RepID=UPI0004B5EF5B|nr:S-layer homology domain-containing protein [Candidatus Synechococcus spongiarum]
MTLAVGRSAGLRRRLQRLLAVVCCGSAALVVGMATPNAAANDLEPDKGQEESIAPVSSINDFRDIGDSSNIANPNYWAYRQLSDLVKEHGCVAGFPDGTFQGEWPATRFEMVTLLNSCLESFSAKSLGPIKQDLNKYLDLYVRTEFITETENFIAENKITTNNLYRSTFLNIGFSIGLAIDFAIKLIYNEKKQMLLYIMVPILTPLLAFLLGNLTKPNKDIEERSKVEMSSSTVPAVSTVQYRFNTS